MAWQPFSLEKLKQVAVDEGHTVLVDFSAEWCINCKFFEKTVLHTKAVEQAIARAGAVTMYGDYTKYPPEIDETIKALKAIQAATVLLVDDLVSDAIVAHASPTARIVYVGKRGGCKSTPQAFIEKLMLMAVNEGENVVRLKGGDPFIFGRGGEEVEHLRAAPQRGF